MGRNWLKIIIYAGHLEESSADVRKQILVIALFSQVSVILLTVFGIDALRQGHLLQAAIELSFAAVSICNYFYLCRTGNYRSCSVVIVVLMMTLALYLLCSGGTDNTGPIWFFVMPGLIFYVLGLRHGAMVLALLLGSMVFILYVPNNPLLYTDYPAAFIHRFVAAVFSVSIVAFVYEYTREDGRRELLNLSRKLDRLSRKDELTGLSNRRDILEKLRNELCRLERSGNTFSIIIADIDHFKVINDTYSHECGDHVLQRIAETLAKNTQKRDTVARWGGEEFLLLLPETTGKQAVITAERLRLAIENLPIGVNGIDLHLTISIGVAEYCPGLNIDELINAADGFLYQAKAAGRNRVKSSIT